MKIDQFSVAAVNKASVDAGIKLAQLGAEAVAKVIKLQTQSVSRLYQDSAGNAKLLTGSGDVGASLQVFANWPKSLVERTVAYGRDVTDVALSTQSVAARIMDDAFLDYRRDVLETVERNMLHVPLFGGNWALDAPLNVMTRWFDSTTAGFKNMARLADFAEALPETPVAIAKPVAKKKKRRK